MKPLHEKLKELRQEKGWSLRDAAKKIPLSHTAYAKFENGLTDPTWSYLVRLAKIYGINPIELVHHEIVTLRGLEHQHKIDDIYDVLIAMNKELRNLTEEREQVQDLKNEINALKKAIEVLKKTIEKKRK